jgi:hypothetical protein
MKRFQTDLLLAAKGETQMAKANAHSQLSVGDNEVRMVSYKGSVQGTSKSVLLTHLI